MITEMEGMNASVKMQRFYVLKDGVEKIISKPFRLMLIEPKSIDQISTG